ncbi:MAG TPA: HAD-IIIC family phosphatase [Chloroflexia bacterium]|jgi:magnesium-dependent phosphatase-1
MKLLAFDGDNTLWEPLDALNVSDRTPTDAEGWPHFTFAPADANPLVVVRDDGARFALRPEAREVLQSLKSRSVLLAVVSYNHEGNIRRILEAFGVLGYFDYVVAEFHSNKDRMLDRVRREAHTDGHELSAADLMLVDDDPDNLYRGQCARMGAAFSCFGTDIHDLREVLPLLDGPSHRPSAAGSHNP